MELNKKKRDWERLQKDAPFAVEEKSEEKKVKKVLAFYGKLCYDYKAVT